MDRGTAIVLTLVAYKLLLLGIGWWGQRRTKNAADYFLGGRGLGPLVAAVSASASSSSAWTILSVSGQAYLWGISALWFFPACVGGFFLNWYVLAPGLRAMTDRTGALTITELVAGERTRPFHHAIRTVGSLIIVVSLGFYVCSQFQGAGKTFVHTFPDHLSLEASIAIGGGIVVAYTLLGGFWAVSLTDTLQGLLMALTAIVVPAAALFQVGGPAALLDGLEAVRVPGFLDPLSGGNAAGIGFVFGILGIGLGYPGQAHVVNRMMALSGGPGALRSARRIALSWAVIVYSGMILLGLCGRVLWDSLPDNESLFIHATNSLFHPVLAGVMIAAVLSAIMSTADSQLLVAGASVTHDLRLGGQTRETILKRSRLTVLGLSAIAIIAAMETDTSIFQRVLFAWGAVGAAFGPVLVVTALTRRLPAPGWTLASMIAGCTLSVFAYYAFPGNESKWLERVVPYMVAGVLAVAGARKAA
ncbi:MAG: sodium:proline symporter [Planctomycetes bacterium]|nr:sodium:proline symporter [Planctomycetota bacterium]